MSEKTDEIKRIATECLNDSELLADTLEKLNSSSRRLRQNAASVLAQVGKQNIELLVPYTEDFVSALEFEESQTRWECLEVLNDLVPFESRTCEKAFSDAEDALFDEDNGFVRLAALKYFCKLGATTENRSEKVWPLLDEAIQCYHGNLEFQDMLNALIAFSEGKLTPEVKQSMASRFKFDAENAKGALQRKSQQILDNLQ